MTEVNRRISRYSLRNRAVRRRRHAAAIFVTPPPPVITDRRAAAPPPTVCRRRAGAGAVYCTVDASTACVVFFSD